MSNDCVIVPGFGGFMAHHVDARYDGIDSMFLPPTRTIGFNPQLQMNDSLLALSYVEAYDISYPEALNRIADEVAEIKLTLENTGRYEFNDIGTIVLNEDGNYAFEPCEAGILTPELYGLGGFDIRPTSMLDAAEDTDTANAATIIEMPAKQNKEVAPEKTATPFAANNSVFIDEDDSTAEFISIKKSWLRNLAAACIAIIAFFSLSTPLETPNVQKSQIDTGMLTRIMPKELTIAQPRELQLTNEAKPENSIPSKSTTVTQDKELLTPTSYYSIVLASRVTKRNAANYAESLQDQGFKETRVLITANNVKVIYGTYATESEAYSALNSLHNKEAFADGWITKVNE